VRVTSWFAEEGTLAARRDWVLRDARTGALLGCATSTWLTFNLQTRRMARLPLSLRAWFQTASPQPPRFAFAAAEHVAEPDLAAAEGGTSPPPPPEKLSELLPDTPCCLSSSVRVRRCDMDFNLHVNNASYIAWLLDDVPQSIYDGCRLAEVNLEYRAEVGYGDEITSRVRLAAPDGECILPGGPAPAAAGGAGGNGDGGWEALSFRHSLLRGGAEVLRARTGWVPRAGEGRRDHH